MITRGRTTWFQLDTNTDGNFDHTITRPFSAAASKDRGYVCITGYNLAEVDNFKFFDAVLQEDTTTLPKIGTVYKMSFTADLVNALPTPWIVVLSLGKAGIPVFAGRQIPLSLDASSTHRSGSA